VIDSFCTIRSGGRPAGFSSSWAALTRWFPAALVVFAFYIFMVRPDLLTRTVPGDLGDARFNLYILEHTFKWMGDRGLSYISPAIFYPYPGTMFFSDTHIGSVPFYIIFRALGISEFTSFTLWFYTGYLLTLVASYYALLQFKFKPLAAITAAIIFSFSLPSLAQFGHSQLVYRFGVPLAFLSLWSYLRTGLVRHLVSLAAWVGLQTLCSIYVAVFLMLTLGIFAAWSVLLNRHLHPLPATLRNSLEDARSFVGNPSVRRWSMLLLAALLVIAAILPLAEYRIWSSAYGLGRSWQDIADMLPRPQSYLLMEILPYWHGIYRALVTATVPMAHEHNMFMGLGALTLFLVGAAAAISGGVPRHQENLPKIALLTLATLFVLLTMFGSKSLYFFLTYLPGLNSIRAVTRIVVVFMFPVSVVVATGVNAMLRFMPRLPGLIVLCTMLTIVTLEISMLKKSRFLASESETRTDAIVNEARRKSAGIANPILFVLEGDQAPYLVHLDAMLAAQQLGWPTANGYSGNGVPGSEYRATCDSPLRQVTAYESWRRLHHVGEQISANDFMKRLVMVGWPDCGPGRGSSSESAGLGSAHLGPAPDPASAQFVVLVPRSLERRQSQLVFAIGIRNNGEARLAVNSFNPVRASWRFVEVGESVEKGAGWNSRVQIAEDILPHTELNVILSADLPRKPGNYRLEVSLVAEHGFWFHDHGTAIMQFGQIIPVQ
jgi:hypothetical protein